MQDAVLVLPLPTDITELQWKDHRSTYISDQGHTDKGLGESRIWTRPVPSDMGSYWVPVELDGNFLSVVLIYVHMSHE